MYDQAERQSAEGTPDELHEQIDQSMGVRARLKKGCTQFDSDRRRPQPLGAIDTRFLPARLGRLPSSCERSFACSRYMLRSCSRLRPPLLARSTGVVVAGGRFLRDQVRDSGQKT